MYRYIILLISFFLLSFLSWNLYGILFLFNIIILFHIIDCIQDRPFFKKIIYSFPFFLCLNISATFWLFTVDPIYASGIFIFNTILMTFSFSLVNLTIWKNKKIAFIMIWPISEWILSQWDLSWPWLTFGNVLGNQWYLIQWYAVTGVYGGTLWLLYLGCILYLIKINGFSGLKCFALLLGLSFPVFSITYYLMPSPEIKGSETIVFYIPESLKDSSYNKTRKMLSVLSSNKIDNNSKIITPELFFLVKPGDLTYGNIHYLFKNYLTIHNVTFIVGSEIENDIVNKFNGISVINSRDVLFRTKKKYVPVTEYTPKPLTPLFGKSFYAKNRDDDSQKIMEKLNIFPFVCYEILFSDFVAEKTYNTSVIMVLVSEAFMNGSLLGSMQYDNIVRIRAIENNRYLVKNSYLGKSLLISPKGEIMSINKSFSKIKVPVYQKNTFYQKLVVIFN